MQLILITQLERTKGRHSFPWTVRSQNKKETKEEKEGREGRREFPWWLLEKLEEKGRKRVSTLYPKLAESGPVRTMKMLETSFPTAAHPVEAGNTAPLSWTVAAAGALAQFPGELERWPACAP